MNWWGLLSLNIISGFESISFSSLVGMGSWIWSSRYPGTKVNYALSMKIDYLWSFDWFEIDILVCVVTSITPSLFRVQTLLIFGMKLANPFLKRIIIKWWAILTPVNIKLLLESYINMHIYVFSWQGMYGVLYVIKPY